MVQTSLQSDSINFLIFSFQYFWLFLTQILITPLFSSVYRWGSLSLLLSGARISRVIAFCCQSCSLVSIMVVWVLQFLIGISSVKLRKLGQVCLKIVATWAIFKIATIRAWTWHVVIEVFWEFDSSSSSLASHDSLFVVLVPLMFSFELINLVNGARSMYEISTSQDSRRYSMVF